MRNGQPKASDSIGPNETIDPYLLQQDIEKLFQEVKRGGVWWDVKDSYLEDWLDEIIGDDYDIGFAEFEKWNDPSVKARALSYLNLLKLQVQESMKNYDKLDELRAWREDNFNWDALANNYKVFDANGLPIADKDVLVDLAREIEFKKGTDNTLNYRNPGGWTQDQKDIFVDLYNERYKGITNE